MTNKKTRIDYTGFSKVYTSKDHVEVRCLICKLVMTNVSARRLNIHRKTHKSTQSTNGSVEPENFPLISDTPTSKSEKLPFRESTLRRFQNLIDDGKPEDESAHFRVNKNDYPFEFQNLDQMDEKEANEYLDKLVARFFLCCGVSFKIVESQFFIDLVEALNKCKYSYKPPHRKILEDIVLRKVHEDIESERKRVLQNQDCVLLVDSCKNEKSDQNLLVFSVRTIRTPQTFLHVVENTDSLAEDINLVINLAKTKYNSNVYGVVTDSEDPIGLNSKIWQSCCVSHSGNSIFDYLDKEDDFFETMRSLHSEFEKSQLHSLLLRNGGKAMKVSTETMPYFRESIDLMLYNLPIIQDIIERDDVVLDENLKAKIRDEVFEKELEIYSAICTPLSTFVKKCESPVCNIADSTQHWLELKNAIPVRGYDALIAERMKRTVWATGYAANLLHHKYQGNLLKNDQYKEAEEFLYRILNEEGVGEYEDFDFNDERFGVFTNKCGSPITFWNLVSPMVPNLAKIAIKLILMPASTAMVESLLSHWKYMDSGCANRLGLKRSCDLIDVYCSLHREGVKKLRL